MDCIAAQKIVSMIELTGNLEKARKAFILAGDDTTARQCNVAESYINKEPIKILNGLCDVNTSDRVHCKELTVYCNTDAIDFYYEGDFGLERKKFHSISDAIEYLSVGKEKSNIIFSRIAIAIIFGYNIKF